MRFIFYMRYFIIVIFCSVVAVAMIVALRFLLNLTNSLLGCLLSFVLFVTMFLVTYKISKELNIKAVPRFDGKRPRDKWVTKNGIGTSLFGEFRYDEHTRTKVKYEFFCIFHIPICPTGCWRIGQHVNLPKMFDGSHDIYNSQYEVLGSEQPYKLEIILILATYWSGYISALLLIVILLIIL